MSTVGIVQLGPKAEGISIERIVTIGNKAQRYFKFEFCDRIQTLGNPDEGVTYRASTLFKLIDTARRSSSIDILVGVVDQPLYWDLFSAVNKDNSGILVSTHQNVLRDNLSRSGVNLLSYVLFETAAQLLTIKFRRRRELLAEPEDCALPWHRETKSCIFDYSETLEDTKKKLMSPKLCAVCLAELEKSNLESSAQDACIRLINIALRRKLVNVMKDLARNNVVTFLFSGWLGALINEIVRPSVPIWLISALVALVLIGTASYQYWRSPSVKR